MASLALRKLKKGGGRRNRRETERGRREREGAQSDRVTQRERKREEGFKTKQTVNEKKGI